MRLRAENDQVIKLAKKRMLNGGAIGSCPQTRLSRLAENGSSTFRSADFGLHHPQERITGYRELTSRNTDP